MAWGKSLTTVPNSFVVKARKIHLREIASLNQGKEEEEEEEEEEELRS